jgi:hypothetical protein
MQASSVQGNTVSLLVTAIDDAVPRPSKVPTSVVTAIEPIVVTRRDSLTGI